MSVAAAAVSPEDGAVLAYGPSDFAIDAAASSRVVTELERFRTMLADENGRMNLVGPSALADFWRRHALDSAQLLALAPQARVWCDLGAGAGFPGLVLAILLKETPDAMVHLVESMAKRARFLGRVAEALNLPALVHTARAEALAPPAGLEVVTARACAPLSRLLHYAQPYLKGRTIGLFLKGERVEEELTEARRTWRFHADLQPSVSDPGGRVVRIERLARA